MPNIRNASCVVAMLVGLVDAPAAWSGDVAPLDDARAIIREAQRISTVRGIDEVRTVEIGGIKQVMSIRGRDRRNPILLFIHGGPASPEMPARWIFQSGWEDYFTVVQWDQRGAGKTYTANDPAIVGPTINVERMVNDGEEVAAYLRAEFNKSKLIVLGHSWGSVIGIEIARRHPRWLHAYIGMGQFVEGRENESVGYKFAMDQARTHANAQAIEDLESVAPYPRADGTLSIEQLSLQRKWLIYYGGLTWDRHDYDYAENAAKISPEYTTADLASAEGVAESTVRLLPGLAKLDYRDLTKLDCPVILFEGRHDYETPSAVSAAWFKRLRAPLKKMVWFENSAHVLQFEEPGKLLIHLVRDVWSIAARNGDAAPIENGVGDGIAPLSARPR